MRGKEPVLAQIGSYMVSYHYCITLEFINYTLQGWVKQIYSTAPKLFMTNVLAYTLQHVSCGLDFHCDYTNCHLYSVCKMYLKSIIYAEFFL